VSRKDAEGTHRPVQARIVGQASQQIAVVSWELTVVLWEAAGVS